MKHRVKEIKLKNGAEGLLIHVPDASVVTFEFSFRAGEYLVPREKWETPHLMEHILLGANERIPRARLFQAEFEKNGAYCNASTGTYDVTYEAECADFEWDRVLDLLLVAITKPLFLEEEFQAEFGNVREELNARSNNHFRHLSLALRGKYGFLALTDEERLALINNVTIKDIRTHYEKTHTTSNMRFVVAGNFTAPRKKKVVDMLELMEMPRGNGLEKLPQEKPKKLGSPLCIPNDTVNNLYFYFDTFKQARLSDAQTDSLNLINSMLTETLYSRILGTARERGLVYHMSSGINNTKDSTNWWFGAQITPEHAEQLFDIILLELKNVFNGQLADIDVEAAKQFALGRHQRSAQTVAGVANGYSIRYFFDGKVEDYYQIPDRIAAITKEGIVSVTNDMFKDKTWGLGLLGNCNKTLAKQLHAQLETLWS